MYPTIIPPSAGLETPDNLLDAVTPDALDALGITDHDELFADELAAETEDERSARLAAAADILDDRLSEIAATTLTREVVRGWAL